jgi:hypothetical protein
MNLSNVIFSLSFLTPAGYHRAAGFPTRCARNALVKVLSFPIWTSPAHEGSAGAAELFCVVASTDGIGG